MISLCCTLLGLILQQIKRLMWAVIVNDDHHHSSVISSPLPLAKPSKAVLLCLHAGWWCHAMTQEAQTMTQAGQAWGMAGWWLRKVGTTTVAYLRGAATGRWGKTSQGPARAVCLEGRSCHGTSTTLGPEKGIGALTSTSRRLPSW